MEREWPNMARRNVQVQVQGSLARDAKGPVIQNHSCNKGSRLDQLCKDKCQGECFARCSANEREHSRWSEGE